MMALSGVRSSCDMFARNSDLCWFAISSCRLLSWISRNRRAFWMAIDRLVGEGLQQRDVLVGERADVVAADEDGADAIALPQHRREDQRLDAGRATADDHAGRHLVAALERPENATTCRPHDRGAGSGLSSIGGREDLLAALAAGTVVGAECRISPSSPTRLIPIVLPANRRSQLVEDLVEHRRRVGDRTADRGENFARRPLLVERFLRLVEQAHVVDGDGAWSAKVCRSA